MAIQPLKYYGAQVLRRQAKEITNVDFDVRMLARDMLETMYHFRGVGLAAPQIGLSKRLFLVDCGAEYQDEPIVLINPEIVEVSGHQLGEEGCLSIPELFLPVARPMRCVMRGIGLEGKVVEFEGEELLARALLHELDHLNGKLFIDYVEDAQKLAEELPKVKQKIQEILAHMPEVLSKRPEPSATPIE